MERERPGQSGKCRQGEKNKYREQVRGIEGKKERDADQDKGMEK